MGNHPRRSHSLKEEQLEERFSTDGLDFERALEQVLAVEPDDRDHAEREAHE